MKGLRQFVARHVSLFISFAVTLAGLVVFAYSGIGGHPAPGFAFVQNIELRSLDARFNLRGKRATDPAIVIVDIDEKTLQREGAFPISRSAYARLIDRLHASGARIIAFDVTFPTPEKNSAVEVLEELRGVGPSPLREKIAALQVARDNDRRLAESMKKSGNVILGHIFLDKERATALDVAAAEAYFEIAWGEVFPRVIPVKTGKQFQIGQAWEEVGGPVSIAVEANIKPLAEAALSYGFFNNAPDADGTMRRSFLLYRYQELDWYPSLSFQVVREYLKIPDQELIAWMTESGLERIEFGPHTLRTRQDGSVLINFAGPYGTYRHYSTADVLQGTVAEDAFRDKIVFVGPTALGIGDIRHTPFAGPEYMGVEIHANVVDNLLHVAEPSRTFLVREKRQDMADIAAILAFGLLFGIAFSALRPLFSTLAALAGLGGFLVLVSYAFDHWGMWLSFVIPTGTLLVNYAAVTSYRVIVEEREKRKVRAMFSQYVAPSVIRLLEQDPGRYLLKGGELKELTLMFTDIRGFTALSEELPPDEVVRLVNQHFDEMTTI
ncbi:MAG: CHASE2 domain-containing protein, partial [Terriglobales bacterium]